MGNHICRYREPHTKIRCKEKASQECMGLWCGRRYCGKHPGHTCGYKGCNSKVCSRCVYLTDNTMCKYCCKMTRHMKIIYS